MKSLWLIAGPMGAGKSAVGRELRDALPRSVYLDGDWCWDARPFVVTEETKRMVLGNIRHLLAAFPNCSEYENVVFTWVMPSRAVVDAVLEGLPPCGVRAFSLTCSAPELERRLRGDILSGLRDGDAVRRGLSYLPLYPIPGTAEIDTTYLTAHQAAMRIIDWKGASRDGRGI